MNEVIINLNGVIDDWGYFFSQVKYHLDQNPAQTVRFRINSYGGSVTQALAISKLLESHGNVIVEFMGFAASAVTWMAYGAKKVIMHEDTLWLCHKCSLHVDEWGYKTADDLGQLITELTSQKKSAEVIDLTIAKKYLDRCKDKTKKLQDILNLMSEDRYLPSEECLKWGFVDEVIPGINKAQVQNLMPIVDSMHLPAIPSRLLVESGSAPSDSNIFDRFFERLADFFSSKDKSIENKVHTTQTQNNTTMNETYQSVNSLLGVSGLPDNDGNITLTTDQMNSINTMLATVAAAETALDGISGHIKNISGLTNKVNALKLVLDRVPTDTPSTVTAKTDDKNDTIDMADMNDPVNAFAQSFRRK